VDALALGTGFVLGLRHSLDPDHMAALAQFASAQPAPRRGLLFGLRWGAGHSIAVLLLGAVLVPAGIGLGAGYERAAEVAVGLMLVGLALWRLRSLVSTEHVHPHRHADGTVHSHPHRHGRGHVHAHAPTAAGFVHGVAGMVGVLALTPLAEGALGRALVILAFAAGSIVSMGLFGALAGRLFASLDAAPKALRAAAGLTAAAGLAIGLLWIQRAL
jgi:ABC-type nickel/cobalt efflux system permease component RcnA